MKRDSLISISIGVLYPFILLLGVYIVMQGDLSPGGGFQGGAIFSAIFILRFFVLKNHEIHQEFFSLLEKVFIIAILSVVCLSFFTTKEFFANIFPTHFHPSIRRIYLVMMNFFIAIKVSCGLTIIFYQFIFKGREEL